MQTPSPPPSLSWSSSGYLFNYISYHSFPEFIPLMHFGQLASQQISQACSHFHNFVLTLPSVWNVLSLNSQTTPSLNYSNPNSNFLNHPIQNSTYSHLNCSLSSYPSYTFTIRVSNFSNWCHVCLLSEPHTGFKIHETGTLFRWPLCPQYLQHTEHEVSTQKHL